MLRSLLCGWVSCLLLAHGAHASDATTIQLDLCIGGSCKNGRIKSITVTPDRFILVVDPDLCRGIAHFCPSSYSAFLLEGDVRARVEGYVPGEKTAELFTVYVPRAYKTLYIEGLKRGGGVASIDLRPYERHAEAASTEGPSEGVSELTRMLDEEAAAEPAGDRADSGDDLAVVFGIGSYRYAPSAAYADRDAAVFRDYLLRRFGYRDDRILFRVDGQATGGEFSRAFSLRGWVDRRATPQTDLLVYFAGHGAVDARSGEPVLLPHDVDPEFPASAYPLEQLLANLAATQARSVTVILDASFGGHARDDRPLVPDATDTAVRSNPAEVPERTLLFLAASDGENNAALDERQHGLFTYYFLRGATGEADADADRRITGEELVEYVGSAVSGQTGATGRPQHPGLRGADRGRVVFRY